MPLRQVNRQQQKQQQLLLLQQSMTTSTTKIANSDTDKDKEGFISIYPASANYGSVEEGEQRGEVKQGEQMRELEQEYQHHQQHCRRHNISAYNYYAQSELAFQSATSLPDNNNNNNNNNNSRTIKMIEKWLSIRWIGAALFCFASIFCLYEIWVLSNEKPPIVTSKLLMVNIFTRHGDRAPSDNLPKGDQHPTWLWPGGLHNLTDTGRYRMYRIGLETRRKYSHYLGYDSKHILALSSPIYRCQDSLQAILKGLYNMDITRDQGRALVSKMTNCSANFQCPLPSGSGSPDEWLKVKIDTETLPTLTYEFLNNCAYRKNNPSPVDSDLMNSKDVKSLPAVEKLRDIIEKRYDQKFDFFALGLWSTITSELNLVRTESTYNYTNHYNDWINNVIIGKQDYSINLYDLYEQVAVFAYRDRVAGEANHIQTGQLVTSIVESQMVAIGYNATNSRMDKYKDKKMILYSSHDSVLQLILHTLNVINIESSFENRFSKWYKSQDGVGKMLSGIRMSSYGMSMRFELWELESINDNTKFRFVQLSIYNEDEAKFRDVDYKIVDFGTACNRLFKKRYPKVSSEELLSFYKTSFQFDKKRNCPFELFRNVTSNMLIDDVRIHQLCDTNMPKM